MKKAEADIEAKKIFDEWYAQTETAWKALRAKGWKTCGLDGEKPPEIKAIDDKYKRKIKELAAQIEDYCPSQSESI